MELGGKDGVHLTQPLLQVRRLLLPEELDPVLHLGTAVARQEVSEEPLAEGVCVLVMNHKGVRAHRGALRDLYLGVLQRNYLEELFLLELPQHIHKPGHGPRVLPPHQKERRPLEEEQVVLLHDHVSRLPKRLLRGVLQVEHALPVALP